MWYMGLAWNGKHRPDKDNCARIMGKEEKRCMYTDACA
jgi:hypothetical protein